MKSWSTLASRFGRCLTWAMCWLPCLGSGWAQGVMDTVAGSGSHELGPLSGSATEISISQPFGVEFGPDGGLYICAVGNHRLLRFDPRSHMIETIAGTGVKGLPVDGARATATPLSQPYEVRFDHEGTLFFVDMRNALVCAIEAGTQTLKIVAGTGNHGFSGDGGAATEAELRSPHSIALDGRGGLYVADIGNHRIRRIDLESGTIETVAGNGGLELPRDGTVATGRPMLGPRALFIVGDRMWIALREGHSVWSMNLDSRRLTHVAGAGKKGYQDGIGRNALFSGPKGIVAVPDGPVYVVDTENQSIRRVEPATGEVTTVAGGGPLARGYGGDGGAALEAKLDRPHGIAVDARGTLFIGDTNNHRVRRVAQARRP